MRKVLSENRSPFIDLINILEEGGIFPVLFFFHIIDVVAYNASSTRWVTGPRPV